MTPTVTDVTASISTFNSKAECQLVGTASSTAAPVSSNNDCSCSAFGSCGESGDCACQSGYDGYACSYSSADYLSITAQITDKINSLSASVGTAND